MLRHSNSFSVCMNGSMPLLVMKATLMENSSQRSSSRSIAAKTFLPSVALFDKNSGRYARFEFDEASMSAVWAPACISFVRSVGCVMGDTCLSIAEVWVVVQFVFDRRSYSTQHTLSALRSAASG